MEKRYIAYVRMVSKYASTLFPVKVSKRGERNSNISKYLTKTLGGVSAPFTYQRKTKEDFRRK